MLQQEVDRVSGANRQMEQMLQHKHKQLKDLVDSKTDKERQGWIADENLRKAKNDLFNSQRELNDTTNEEGKR